KIIIIAPSSLRKQWSMELKEKFFLDSFILDGKSYKDEVAKGNKNPFEQKDKIVITSYQFASRHNEAMFLAGFQLSVIDEAHKMRNYLIDTELFILPLFMILEILIEKNPMCQHIKSYKSKC
ncbi:MAG TPA: hypothetical protein ENK95_02340, partial [Campylobacterales bacterium]|nr:hypothetical protein [Campylobacterales bacterium]